ncbi:UDP-3-O-(3-hydroxymyristoyl)glucosamine N-acyltransferase, partial [bacterium]|nr:UDP-3-O-(3-hydroxymyristoyl)glucosamine N-acyltransferase [bacterium]
ACVGGEIRGNASLLCDSAATLETAGPQAITLVDTAERMHLLAKSRAAAAVVPRGTGELDRTTIEVDDVHAAFATIVRHFRPQRMAPSVGISPQAAVDPSAQLGAGCEIHPFATIGADVVLGENVTVHSGCHVSAGCRIGRNTVLHAGASLYEDTIVGERVIVHANAVLGANGFGYKVVDGRYELSAQLGWVELGDDVEVGAGTTIDRGTYGPTTIGEGTKIDNMVMIAHNCRIGRHNMICSQVGVAGSTSTGDWVVMAGQVGVRDHVHIGDGAILGARSGVSNDIPAKTTVLGEPAIELRERKLQLATMTKLPQMRKQLKGLLERIAALEAGEPCDRQEAA